MDDKVGKKAPDKDASGKKRQVCPNCGGTGNLSTFHGESRFMLTHEECPFCFGFGYVPEEEDGPDRHENARC